MPTLKLTQVGTSTGAVIPKEMLNRGPGIVVANGRRCFDCSQNAICAEIWIEAVDQTSRYIS